MQYVGRAFDSVSKTWSSINPSTLSGAIDVIVVESDTGDLSCSPFHVRFGKFQLLRPSQKKVDFIINGKLTNLPMKLGDGGEAFFVFETAKNASIPDHLITSPVLSAESSPGSSPPSSPSPSARSDPSRERGESVSYQEPEFLDISQSSPDLPLNNNLGQQHVNNLVPSKSETDSINSLATSLKNVKLDKMQKLSKRLTRINIPTKLDANGDMLLDMNGYKSSDKNIHDSDEFLKKLLSEEFGDDVDLTQFVHEDEDGNYKILSNEDLSATAHNDEELNEYADLDSSSLSKISTLATTITTSNTFDSYESESDSELNSASSTSFVKTLRLTSEQLKFLDLKPGENDLSFSVDKGKAIIKSKLFLWKQNIPIVISDIDGTITKSDALGHVLTMIGRDWTHPGVAKLFHDIELNGYNIMYLTARSVGQADSTRSYLRSIDQAGIKLPHGPVILSPDRTIAALRREVILKKPEVFKMACLNDLKNLYHSVEKPFYAGFGNKITDALSYRSVSIPSSRIFTINPDGEVHMELLELAGYKSSYIFINELVDHFFPPVNEIQDDEGYTDVNFWRDPLPNITDEEEEGPVDVKGETKSSSEANDSSIYQNSIRVTLDDLDKDYDEELDEDYVDEFDDDEEYDDEEEEEEDDEDYDDKADDNDTNGSEAGSYDDEIDDEDLDRDLLEETDDSIVPPQYIPGRVFLPNNAKRKNSGLSLNSTNIHGSIIKASEL